MNVDIQPPTNLRWFTFGQNNSGGTFRRDEKVDEYVIIQAPDPDTANSFAERIGIYFNGVDDGIDCECCGDRWCKIWNNDSGTEKPSIYGQEVQYSNDDGINNGWTSTGNEKDIKVYPYSVISKM